MSVKFSNNGHSTLASSLTSSGTSITVASGHGARFPSLSSGEYFYATLIDASNNLEIVKVTARSSDVLTATRAQESTTARAFAIGDRIELRVTAQGLVDHRVIAADEIVNSMIATDAVNSDSIAANAVTASEFNISGNGTSGQAILSDGDGSFSYGDAGLSVKLASASFTSSAANYDLNFTADDTTYAYYKLYILHLTGGGGSPFMRMKSSGSAVSTNHYISGGFGAANHLSGSSTWSSTRGDDDNANRFHLDQTWTITSSLDDALHYEIMFMALSRTDRTKHLMWRNFVNYTSNGYVGSGIMGGIYNQTPAVNGISVFSSNGSNLTNCEMYLYGFKK